MEYFLHILVISGIYIILTLSLNLIVGFTGLPSLGHIAFALCWGLYFQLARLELWNFPWIGLVTGACIASIFGFVVGFVSIRLKGDYLALATFGLGVIIYAVSKNWVELTRGPMGLPGIPGFTVPGFELRPVWAYLMLVIVFVFITAFIMNRIVDSPFGRILKSIREDELASLSIGKDIIKYKLMVFIIGAFFCRCCRKSLCTLHHVHRPFKLYAYGIGHGAFNGCFWRNGKYERRFYWRFSPRHFSGNVEVFRLAEFCCSASQTDDIWAALNYFND